MSSVVIERRGPLSYTVHCRTQSSWNQDCCGGDVCVCVCVIISSWVAVNYMVTYLRHIDQLRDGINVPPKSDVEVPTGGLSSQASAEELSSGNQITPETPSYHYH